MDLSRIFILAALIFVGIDLLWIIYLIRKRFSRSKLDDRRKKAIRRILWANFLLFALLLSIGVMLS